MDGNKNEIAKGYAALISSTILWGSLYVALKFLSEAITPFMMLACRFFIASLFIGLFYGRKIMNKKTVHVRYGRLKIFLLGFVGYFLTFYTQFLGTKMTNASISSLITTFSPVIIMVLAVIVLKEKVSKSMILSMGMLIIGALVILGRPGDGFKISGVLMLLLSAFLWAIASLLIKVLSKDYDVTYLSFVTFVITFASALPGTVAEIAVGSFDITKINIMVIVALLWCSICSTLLANWCWNYALSKLESSVCGVFYTLQVVVGSALGVILLNEKITINFIIGSIIVIAGVICPNIICSRSCVKGVENEQKDNRNIGERL